MTFGNGKSRPSFSPELPEIGSLDVDEEPAAREIVRDRAVKSVEHALDILDLLARRKKAAGVTQLAEELGMNVSTAHHLLRTLQSRRFVEQDPDSKLYRLGVRSVQIGQAYLDSLDLYAITHPFLRDAALECGETVTLAALDGASIVTLATIPGRYTVRSLGATTNRHNAHATALGKILLAGLPSTELHDMVAESGLTRFTPHTIGTFRQLAADLERVREQGFALDIQELEVDLACAAVGIPNHRGEMMAAIGVSVPIARFDDERRLELINLLRKAAHQIATRLGYEDQEAT